MKYANKLFGVFSLFLQAKLFSSLIKFFICDAKSNRRQAGHRIGEHLEKVIPLVVKFSRVEDDELREYCIQAFESFVRRCPKDVSPHIPNVCYIK